MNEQDYINKILEIQDEENFADAFIKKVFNIIGRNLPRGISIDCPIEEGTGETLLHWLSICDNAREAVECVVHQWGANPLTKNNSGQTSLDCAIESGKDNNALILLKATITEIDNKTILTMLNKLAEKGCYETLKFLLKEKYSLLDTRDKFVSLQKLINDNTKVVVVNELLDILDKLFNVDYNEDQFHKYIRVVSENTSIEIDKNFILNEYRHEGNTLTDVFFQNGKLELIVALSNYIEKMKWEKLSERDKVSLKAMIDKKASTSIEHVIASLISFSKLHNSYSNDFELRKIYEYLCIDKSEQVRTLKQKYIVPIVEVLILKRCLIRCDVSQNNIQKISDANKTTKGEVAHKAREISVGFAGEIAEVAGTLIHEFTHQICYDIWQNECKPYFEANRSDKDRFAKIFANIKQNKANVHELIQMAYDNYQRSGDDVMQSELIVRVPHILIQEGMEKGKKILENQVPELLKYYEDVVLPACKDYLEREQNPICFIKETLQQQYSQFKKINLFTSDHPVTEYLQLEYKLAYDVNNTDKPLAEYVKEKIIAGTKICISGAAGIGKSSLCRYLSYDLSSNPSEKKSVFLINANNLLQNNIFKTPENITLNNIIKIEFFHNINDELQSKWKKFESSLTNFFQDSLWIIDNFDAIANESIWQDFIDKLLAMPNLILTINKNVPEKISILTFEQINISGFSNDSIKKFTEYYFAKKPQKTLEIQNFINSNYTIKTLAKTPLYLILLCQSYKMELDSSTVINIYQLYEKFVLLRLNFYSKTTSITDEMLIRSFQLQCLRVLGFISYMLRVENSSAGDQMPLEKGKILIKKIVDESQSNVNTDKFLEIFCSLGLLKTSDHSLIFLHASFVDFFAACYILHKSKLFLSKADFVDTHRLTAVSVLGEKLLSSHLDVVFFISQKIYLEPKIKENLFDLIDYSRPQNSKLVKIKEMPGLYKEKFRHEQAMIKRAAANAITILNHAKVNFSGKDLSEIRIPDANLSSGIFHNTNFNNANLKRVQFQRSFLLGIQHKHSKLDGVDFKQIQTFFSDVPNCIAAVQDDDGDIIAVGVGSVVKFYEYNQNTKSLTPISEGRQMPTQIELNGTVVSIACGKQYFAILEETQPHGKYTIIIREIKNNFIELIKKENISLTKDTKKLIWNNEKHTLVLSNEKRVMLFESPDWERKDYNLAKDLKDKITDMACDHIDSKLFIAASNSAVGIMTFGNMDIKKIVDKLAADNKVDYLQTDFYKLIDVKTWTEKREFCDLVKRYNSSGDFSRDLNNFQKFLSAEKKSNSSEMMIKKQVIVSALEIILNNSYEFKLIIDNNHSVRKHVSLAHSPIRHEFVVSHINKRGNQQVAKYVYDDANNLELPTYYPGEGYIVTSLAYNKNGSQLAVTWGAGRTIYLFDAENSRVMQSFQGHQDWIMSLMFTKKSENLFSISRDKSLIYWHINKHQQVLLENNIHWNAISLSLNNTDQEYAISDDNDHTIKIIDLKTRACISVLTEHKNTINSVIYHPKRAILASCSNDNTIILWNRTNNTLLQKIRTPCHPISRLTFCDEGHYLVAGGEDGNLHYYMFDNEKYNFKSSYVSKTRIESRRNLIRYVLWHPEKKLFVSGNNRGEIIIFNPADRKKYGGDLQLKGNTAIYSLANLDANNLIAGCRDGKIYRIDISNCDKITIDELKLVNDNTEKIFIKLNVIKDKNDVIYIFAHSDSGELFVYNINKKLVVNTVVLSHMRFIVYSQKNSFALSINASGSVNYWETNITEPFDSKNLQWLLNWTTCPILVKPATL
jgi:WD40 repeat protein